MKYYPFYLLLGALASFSCRSRIATQQLIQSHVDSTITLEESATGLKAALSMNDSIASGSPLELSFAVINPSDSVQRFCKWHTPFEPFLSMYLDLKDDKGKPVAYIGAMAKRIMPPPADAYLSIPAGDTVRTLIDLRKGYDIKEPGTYHLVYRGQAMSGIETANELDFVVVK